MLSLRHNSHERVHFEKRRLGHNFGYRSNSRDCPSSSFSVTKKMSEIIKHFEQAPKLRLFQVVFVPFHDGSRRCVIVEIMPDPNFVGTSEIVGEGTEGERLAIPGTSPVELITLTDEIWGRERVVDSMSKSFSTAVSEARAIVDNMLPKSE